MSWHVTYWDYLGWKDKFAKKEFTERQQKYVELGRVRGLVTPQLMLGNAPLGSGSDGLKSVDREAGKPPQFAMTIAPKTNDGTITASISLKKLAATATLNSTVKIVPLLVRNRATTKPLFGENRGTSLVEHYIVLQAAASIPAADALNAPISVHFDAPNFVDPGDLNITVLLEDAATLTTLECLSAAVSNK